MKGPSAKARWGGLIAILALSILTGGWLLRRKAAPEGTVYQQARLFENVVGSIHSHYIDSIGEGDLYQTAAKALVASLHDPYAELLTRESYRQYQRQMSGTEVDVGLTDGTGMGSARGAFAPGDVILSISATSAKHADSTSSPSSSSSSAIVSGLRKRITLPKVPAAIRMTPSVVSKPSISTSN